MANTTWPNLEVDVKEVTIERMQPRCSIEELLAKKCAHAVLGVMYPGGYCGGGPHLLRQVVGREGQNFDSYEFIKNMASCPNEFSQSVR